MSNPNALNAENLMRVFPEVLANDANLRALAEVIAEKLEELARQTDVPRIYPRIDDLPETIIDQLAYDFKVDWYGYEDDLREKIETLKRSWYVHKHMGTPDGLERAIGAIYPGTKVEEWFEYGGEPYRFRLIIPVTGGVLPNFSTIKDLIRFYKNLRSVLESVTFEDTYTTATVYLSTKTVSIQIRDKVQAYDALLDAAVLVDENDYTLIDEKGHILVDVE